MNHQTVYEFLSDGQHVEGLERLPVPEIVSAVTKAFAAGWEHADHETWDGGELCTFQIFTTPQFVRFDCYGMEDADMNKLIDIAAGFGCYLYDPQVGRRYDGEP